MMKLIRIVGLKIGDKGDVNILKTILQRNGYYTKDSVPKSRNNIDIYRERLKKRRS